MNSPKTGGTGSLLGWLLLLAVAFLGGWGVALFIETAPDKPPAVATQPVAGPSSPAPLPAPQEPVPPAGEVTRIGSLRLTLAETIRVPKPPQRAPVAPPERPSLPESAPPQPEQPAPVKEQPAPSGKPVARVKPAAPIEPPVDSDEKTVAQVKPPVDSDEKTVAQVKPAAPIEPPEDSDILYEEPLPETKEKLSPAPQERKGRRLNTLAIIIDDLGHNEAVSRAMATLPADITLAILPRSPFAHEVARLGKAAGREILLHQPMEPRRYPHITPGPGALFTSMDMASIQAVLRTNLGQLPEAVGVNNHMGSRLTEDAKAMDAVMGVLSEKQLFFIDSRTSEVSVGTARAAAGHVPTAGRDVFLDNIPDEGAIRRQLLQLERLARTQGEAIGIGHPYRETLAALKRWLPTLPEKGIHLQRVSRFLRPATARAHYPDQQSVAQKGRGSEE